MRSYLCHFLFGLPCGPFEEEKELGHLHFLYHFSCIPTNPQIKKKKKSGNKKISDLTTMRSRQAIGATHLVGATKGGPHLDFLLLINAFHSVGGP